MNSSRILKHRAYFSAHSMWITLSVHQNQTNIPQKRKLQSIISGKHRWKILNQTRNQIYQCILKKIICYDQVRLILRMQNWFDIWMYINIINHINKWKRNTIWIAQHTEKKYLKKIPFLIKNFWFLNLIKDGYICKETLADIIEMVQDWVLPL